MTNGIVVANEKDNETNIVCFATQNKWICAPKDQQNIANEKAAKLLEKQSSELETSDVVIKSINFPKFNSDNSISAKEKVVPSSNNDSTTKSIQNNKESRNKGVSQSGSKINLKTISTNNPYAKLWSHQLIGVSSPQGAIKYVMQKQLNKEEVLILKTIRENKDWWIVLYGLYKDKQTGLKESSNLPVNIDPPWLRPLKNLQVKGFIEKF